MNISFKPRNSGRRCKLVQVGASWCKLVQLAMRHASALCQLQSTCLRLDAQLFATSRFLMDSNLNLTNTLERERKIPNLSNSLNMFNVVVISIARVS